VVLVQRFAHSDWIMIGGLAFRAGEDHPDMRLYLVPGIAAEDGRIPGIAPACARRAQLPA